MSEELRAEFWAFWQAMQRSDAMHEAIRRGRMDVACEIAAWEAWKAKAESGKRKVESGKGAGDE